MEKAILAGPTGDIITEYNDFREAWRKAGCPRYFEWGGGGPGKSYTRMEWMSKKRREEEAIELRRRQYDLKEKIRHSREQLELKIARRRLRQRFEEMRARKLAKQRF